MSNIEDLVKDILLNEISNDLAKRIAKALEINEHLTSTYELFVNVEDILSTDRNADPSKSGFYVKLEGTRSGVSFFYDNNLTIRRKPDSRKTRVVQRWNNIKGFSESFWHRWADKWLNDQESLVEKIVKKSDGYYVTSEDGKKNLGGPYDTEDKAKKRLQQVHYFKNKKNEDYLKTDEDKLSVMSMEDILSELGYDGIVTYRDGKIEADWTTLNQLRRDALNEFDIDLGNIIDESLKEAFPWGEEDSFFTREDIDEFTSELQDNVPEDVVIGRGFVEPGNMLEVDWSYEGYEETSKMKIDMRKIKLPSDLIKRFLKPVKEMIDNRVKEIDEENAIGESLKESADSSEFGGELTYIKDQELLSKFDDLYNKYENELNSKLNITLKGEPFGRYSRAWKKASIELDDKRKISIDLSYELPDGIYNYIYIMWYAKLTVEKGSGNLYGLHFSNHFETTDIGEGYHIAYKDGSDEKDEKLTIDELVNIIKSKYLKESLKEDVANKTVIDFDFDIQPWGTWTKITLEDGSTLYGDVHIKFDNPSDHFGTLTTWKWDDIKNAIKQLLNKKYGYNISFKDILTDREIKNSTIDFKSEGLKENMRKIQLAEADGWNINLPRAKDIYRVEFESAKYSTKPPYEKGIKIPYESISVLACSRNAVREFYLRYLSHKAFQFGDAPAYQIFGKLLDISKQEFGNQYQIDLKNVKNYSEAADKLRSGEKLTDTLPAIKLVDVKLTEGVLNDNTLDITDEVNAEYERITKKFPNISKEELEDRLYSAIANILSGYNFVDGDKSKKIDTIVNNLLKNKHNKVDESLKEDCGTKFDNKFNLKEIMDKGASWKDIYDEVKGKYHNKKDQLEGITKVLLTKGYKGRTFDSVEDALVTAMEMQEDMFGWYDPTIEEYDDILFSLSYLRDRKR